MDLPLQITFRDMPPSPALEDHIREGAAKLGELHARITGCRVVVTAPNRHHRHGGHFHVRVEVAVPGRDIVVDRDPAGNTDYEDAHLAVRDAFRAARRILEDHARVRRDEVKTHDRSHG